MTKTVVEVRSDIAIAMKVSRTCQRLAGFDTLKALTLISSSILMVSYYIIMAIGTGALKEAWGHGDWCKRLCQ